MVPGPWTSPPNEHRRSLVTRSHNAVLLAIALRSAGPQLLLYDKVSTVMFGPPYKHYSTLCTVDTIIQYLYTCTVYCLLYVGYMYGTWLRYGLLSVPRELYTVLYCTLHVALTVPHFMKFTGVLHFLSKFLGGRANGFNVHKYLP